MRATFCEICLFNDASQRHDASFILNGVGSKQDRDRVRDGVWAQKGCIVGHELCLWPSIYEGLEAG
jgi:hypothetical protein